MIKGLVLQNFMSYENAYVPLTRGLNLICGPNGAGKSSILLAISVVLGQAYTERARRLSDLVRRGSDQARVSLVLDNSLRNGSRPFQQYRVDTVTITRILRSSGDYSYFLQNRPVSKARVVEAFNKLGMNPDNMLIMMHQLMVGRFSSISSQEKLRMLEEAVGFQSYRRDVLDAEDRLRKVEGEEESLLKSIESSKETYDFWRREYERYLRKKELLSRLQELECELLWAKIDRKQKALSIISTRIESRRRTLESLERKNADLRDALGKRQVKFEQVRRQIEYLCEHIVHASSEKATHQVNAEWANRAEEECRQAIMQLERVERESAAHSSFFRDYKDVLKARENSAKEIAEDSTIKVRKLQEQVSALQEQLETSQSRERDYTERLIETRVESEVLLFRRKLMMGELKDLEMQLKIGKEDLHPLLAKADTLGPKPESIRKISDILTEAVAIEEQLKPLSELTEEVERTFTSYATMFNELKEKAEMVAKNRDEVVSELSKRFVKWQSVMNNFLETLSGRYNLILSHVDATGTVRLREARSMEAAGLDILVGFRGSEPMSVDSLSQSGGERSVALMAFLIALQQSVASPFRAIDEFDVHMDPKNRETISRLIAGSVDSESGQYLVITPGQVEVPDEKVHVIVVQNVDGSSVVGELK